MKFKKLLSLAVVGAMVFAMSISAFAAPGGGSTSGSSTSSGSTAQTVEGGIAYGSEVKTPTVKITVPASGAVVLNPYRLNFTVEGETDPRTDAFYSAPVIAKNESDCKVDVAVSAKATASGDAKIVAAGDVSTSDPGDKNINIVLTVNKVMEATATSVPASGAKTIKFEEANKDYGFGASTDDDATPITLDAATSDAPANYLGFALTGTINSNVSEVWAAADTVSVAIVLTFTPQPAVSST